jgi:hypothetical protein
LTGLICGTACVARVYTSCFWKQMQCAARFFPRLP